MKYELPSRVPLGSRFHRGPLAASLAGLALAAMAGLALAYVFVDRGSEAPAADAAFGVPDVSLDRDAGFVFDEFNGFVPVPASFAAVPEVASTVYVVGSADQMQNLQLGLNEADGVRYQEGLSALGGELVLVPQDGSDAFFAGMAEANSVRAAEGLQPFTVVDLR